MCTQHCIFIGFILLIACKQATVSNQAEITKTQAQTSVSTIQWNSISGNFQGHWQQYNINISLQAKFSEFNSPSLFLSYQLATEQKTIKQKSALPCLVANNNSLECGNILVINTPKQPLFIIGIFDDFSFYSQLSKK